MPGGYSFFAPHAGYNPYCHPECPYCLHYLATQNYATSQNYPTPQNDPSPQNYPTYSTFDQNDNLVLGEGNTGVYDYAMTSDRPAGPPLAAPSSPKNLNPAAPVFRQQDKGRFASDLVSSDKDFNIAVDTGSLDAPLTNGDVHHISGYQGSGLPLGAQSPAAMSMAHQNQVISGNQQTAVLMGSGQQQSFPIAVSPDMMGNSGVHSQDSVSGLYPPAGGAGGEPADSQTPSLADSGGEDGDNIADSVGVVNDAAELTGEEITYSDEVISPIKKQLEYYFSPENLPNDKYINTHMDLNKFVPLSLFITFNRMKPICSSTDQMVRAVQMSSLLELNEDKTKVRISQTRKTLTLRSLPPKATEDVVRSVLKDYECPKPMHVEMINVHKAPVSNWYVSFATEDDCLDAFFKLHNTKVMVDGYSIGCCIKSSGTLAATGSFPSQDENQQRRIAQQAQQSAPVASVTANISQQPAAVAVAATTPQQPTALMPHFNPMAMHPALMASAGQSLYYNQMLQGGGLQPQHIRTQLPRPHMMQNAAQPRFSNRPQRPHNRQNSMEKGHILDRGHDRSSHSQGSHIMSGSRNSPRGLDSNPVASILSSIPRRSNTRDDVTVTIGGHPASGQQHQLVSAVISQPHTVTVGPAASTTIVNSVLDNTIVTVPQSPVSVPVHNQLMHHHQQQQHQHQQAHHTLHPQPLMPNLSGHNPQTSNPPTISHQHPPSHHQPHSHQHHQPPPPIHHHQQQHQLHQGHHHSQHHGQQQPVAISNTQPQQHIPSQHQPPPPPPTHQPHHPHHNHQPHQPPMHATPSHQHHQAQSGPHHHHPHHPHTHHGMMSSQHHQPPQQHHPPHHQNLLPHQHHNQHGPPNFGGRPDPGNRRNNKKRRDEPSMRGPRGDRQPASRSNFSSQVPPMPDNFTMEANSFPPLPGASSTPSSEVSQENRMMHSDIVKGVARVPTISSSAPPPSATRGPSSSTPSPIPTPTLTQPHLSLPNVAAQVMVDTRTIPNDEPTGSIPEDDAASSSQEEADVDVGVVEPVAAISRQLRHDLQVSSSAEPVSGPSVQTRYTKTNNNTAPVAAGPSTYVHKNGDTRQNSGNSNNQMLQQPRVQQLPPSTIQQQQHQLEQDGSKERPSYAQILQNKREAAANELNAAANAQPTPSSGTTGIANGNTVVNAGPQTHQNYPSNAGRSGNHNINSAFREQGNYMPSQGSRPQSQRPPKESSSAARTDGMQSRLPNGRRNSKENRVQSGNNNNSKHDRRKPDGRPK